MMYSEDLRFFVLSCPNLARLWGAVGEIPRSPLRFISVLVFMFLVFSSLILFRFNVLVLFEVDLQQFNVIVIRLNAKLITPGFSSACTSTVRAFMCRHPQPTFSSGARPWLKQLLLVRLEISHQRENNFYFHVCVCVGWKGILEALHSCKSNLKFGFLCEECLIYIMCTKRVLS